MAVYVLTAGAWLGAWCWQPVARKLRHQGHDVYPVSLTGLGEREHLGGPHVDLDTHITDVVNLIEFEDLHDVILLGHSYSGVVVTGVADRIPERISQLVYLDTGPFPDGMALIDTFPPEARQAVEQQVAEQGDGWRLPMPPWEELGAESSVAGIAEAERDLMEARAVDHPFGTYTQPLRLTNPARESLSRVGVLCSFSRKQVQEAIAADIPMFRGLAGPNWTFIELPTGHWPMFSVPHDLAALLHDLAAGPIS